LNAIVETLGTNTGAGRVIICAENGDVARYTDARIKEPSTSFDLEQRACSLAEQEIASDWLEIQFVDRAPHFTVFEYRKVGSEQQHLAEDKEKLGRPADASHPHTDTRDHNRPIRPDLNSSVDRG
jgi:hypothetical protein